jgi:hypothetical protein
MFSPDGRPAPPAVPHFSRELEESLVAAARSRRRPARAKLGRYAAAAIASVAVAVAVAVGIDYAVSNGHPAGASPGSAGRAVHIHFAAFTVDTNAGGTVTVTLTRDHVLDPSALRQALAEAGVPALVTVGSVCYVPGPSDALAQAVSPPRHQADGSTTVTITPTAIPAHSKLSIGYFPLPAGGGIHISLVPDNAPLTCTSTPPAQPTPNHDSPAR